jgi:hypothetical protein
MKTLWAIVIIGVGAYALHEHNKFQGKLPPIRKGPHSADTGCEVLIKPRGLWSVPKAKNTVSRVPPGLRYAIPANGYPNQGGAWAPRAGGYQPPSGPTVNQGNGITFRY